MSASSEAPIVNNIKISKNVMDILKTETKNIVTKIVGVTDVLKKY